MAVCTGVLCNVSVAGAEDTTTTPYPGVTHIRRITSTQRIHVVKVDLARKTIRVRATRPPGGKTVPTFASEYGVHVAINGDFGTRTAPFKTSGFAMGDGDVWSTSDGTLEGLTAFGRDNRVEIRPPAEVLGQPEDWMSEVVGGRPLVVNDGVPLAAVPPWSRDGCDPHFCQPEPRSALGVSQDGATLILATIDGRTTGAAGMTTEQVGVLMAEMGAWRAINIDGGGSTTLVIRSEGGVVNRPSDGCCRVVSNHLGIQIVEPYGDLTGFVRHGAIDNEAEPIAGAAVTLSTGEATTTDAEGRYSFTGVAAGDVTIRASAVGYADASVERYVAAADTTWGSIAMFEPEEVPDAGGVVVPPSDAGPEPGGTMDGGCSVAGRPAGWSAAAVLLFLLAPRRRRIDLPRRSIVSWKKVKRLFVVSEEDQSAATPADLSAVEAQVDADLAALELPAGQVGTLPSGTDPAALKGSIDFQALYDQAGIPNTDEVEQLEKFLEGLDSSLPQASRLAAAKAFLGAIGKAPSHVVDDAGRKIQVVRAVGEVKGTDASNRQNELQAEISRLEGEIEQCRSAMEQINAELENVRHQCAVEEGRLQAARVFFGHLGNVQK
ncbi:MAG TPA: phosphodiester glycosidase family protein [Kofleriaceae bacterium]|nr:phosphodiester glycosidase family protein [Kofleriaceae bacterium]